MSQKEEIRDLLQLSEIISEHVQLMPVSNKRLRGLCPFHKEKTPSFYVDDERGVYHCFGCKASGDIFSFVQNIEGLSFSDALRKLALRAGVQLEVRYGEKNDRDLYDINEFALEFFRQYLQQSEQALAYLAERGVSDDSIAKFELGLAPTSWDALLQQVKSLGKGISEKQLLEVGLIGQNAQTGRLYDRFRGRLIFPIRDHLQRLMGFGGRTLSDEMPKYLNTPETSLFKKGSLLYGLSKAREKQSSELILVEGYMDVIAMHQAGLTKAVATLGTALTAEHAQLLERLGLQQVNLLFDQDEAGQQATLRGLDQALGSRLRLRASRLPTVAGVKDPADLLQHPNGMELLQKALSDGLDEARFRIQSLVERYGTTSYEGKRQILHALLPRMQNLDPLDEGAAYMRKMACELLGIQPVALSEWINSKAKRKTLSATQLKGMSTSDNSKQDHHSELAFLQQLLINPRLWWKLSQQTYQHPQVGQIMQVAQQLVAQELPATQIIDALLKNFSGQPAEQLIIRLLFEGQHAGTLSKVVSQEFSEKLEGYASKAVTDLQIAMNIERLEAQIGDKMTQLSSCTTNQQLALLADINELQKAIEAEKRFRRNKN